MALSDLAVFSEYAYETMTEVLNQKVDLFNQATGGAITLSKEANKGDFSDAAFFGKISGLVRRRNVYGSGNLAEKSLQHLVDTSVKVASGTPPIRIDKSYFTWIQQNPQVAGAVIGQQLAVDKLSDMLNLVLGAGNASLSGQPEVVYDASASSTDPKMSFSNLNRAQSKFGDQSSNIVAWIMHSKPMHDLYEKNVQNMERLFSYSTVNVMKDPFGKLLVMTDSPNLVAINEDPALTNYYALGLVAGGLRVEQNNDFDANEEVKNGQENLVRTYQAEWTYNVGVQGFSWDKANGGHSPNDGAVLMSSNWKRISTSHKDLAGVSLIVK